MGALATILASILTSIMTVIAALAAMMLFGGRRAAALGVAPLPAGRTAPIGGVASPPIPAAAPSNLFSVHRARLDFPDDRAFVGRPCRVRFAWALFNGAHSYISFRSRIRAQAGEGEAQHELCEPQAAAPRGTSYQQRIVGGIDSTLTWNRPGIYEVRARVKASIEGTPFTYQFEIKRRVRVVEAKLEAPSGPMS